MKVIDLLNKIANGDIPKKIKYKDLEYRACGNGISGFTDYANDDDRYCFSAHIGVKTLNDEVEIIEDNDDLELIPDDELHIVKDYSTNWNCRVLKDKINELVKEINEIRKEMK